jgi:hypothetical protein
MNGVVERAMQTVNQRARSMIYQAKLPEKLWDYAVEHVVYLKNRVLTVAIQVKIPIEAYSRVKPAIGKLRIFGCAAYPLKPKETHPTTYKPRFRDKDYILVGMSGSSIYRLLSLKSLKETMLANVAFDEYTFPASNNSRPPELGNTDGTLDLIEVQYPGITTKKELAGEAPGISKQPARQTPGAATRY